MVLRHVQEQREGISNQEDLIVHLARHNLSTRDAEDFLDQMHDLLEMIVDDMDSRRNERQASDVVEPHGKPSGTPVSPRRLPTMKRHHEARQAILTEWKTWVTEHHVEGASDAEAHAFLRLVRTNRPELLKFRCKTSPYETAFGWLVEAGFIPA